MDQNTRQGALKDFTYMTDYELDDTGPNDLNQQTKSILVSPALIYKGDRKQDMESSLPEEELIKRQQWSCYGSTEVEYLVLKDPKTGKEEIAALAPQNSGLSVRHIQADDGCITSYAIGFLNIVVDTGPVVEEDKNVTDTASGNRSSEIGARPSPQDAMEASKTTLNRMASLSGKFITQMNQNAHFLADTLQDDFAKRTYQAGGRIYSEFPKTVVRTTNFISKMIAQLSGDDDDGD